MSPGFISRFDSWLQQAVAFSKEQLANNWLDRYLTAPFWRYALAPDGIVGSGYIGVLMSSVDSVGRYYPLTIASPWLVPEHVGSAPMLAQSWFGRAEELALTTLEQAMDPERLFEAVVALNGYGQEHHTADLFTGPSWPEEDEHTTAISYWWTADVGSPVRNLMTCKGFPEPSDYSRLLAGQSFSARDVNGG